jgi:acetyl esterase
MATSLDLQVPVPATENALAGEILVRIHYPLQVAGSTPAIVFFHGGGFTVGDVESYDAVCRDIAAQTGFPVASVDYRLGPEHPAPTSSEDCLAAWTYLVNNASALSLDPSRLAVMGDSAGGKLSAVIAQQTLLRGLTPPALQVLVYPGLDLEHHYASSDTYGVGFGLEQATIDWFMAQYVDDPKKHLDLRVSPLLSEELSGLAPAIVAVARDPLRDEGLRYAERLSAAGVSTQLLDYPHLIHGFFTMGGAIPVAAAAVAELLGRTRSLLSNAG